METSLLQLNSDPLLAQFNLDGFKAKQYTSTKTPRSLSNYDGRETQVYVVPSSKSDTPALIVWSRPLNSRKRLSSSTCTLTPEELLGVSAAKRALSGISPWSDGREKFDDLNFDELTGTDSGEPANAAAAVDEIAASTDAVTADASTAAASSSLIDRLHCSQQSLGSAATLDAARRRLSLQNQPVVYQQALLQQPANQRYSTAQTLNRQPTMSLGIIGPHSPCSAVGDASLTVPNLTGAGDTALSRSRLQGVYTRYSEKQAFKRLLKVLRRHPYLDKESVKYNKLLLLEYSLNVCQKFQANQQTAGFSNLQRPETLEDLAVEESHLVSAIREHVTEIPYLAGLAPKTDRRATKIAARVRRMEKLADSCHNCHAMLCAYCLTASLGASSSSSSSSNSNSNSRSSFLDADASTKASSGKATVKTVSAVKK